MKNYWLVKQEPEAYSWSDLVHDDLTKWTGVRNFQARNNLRAMRKGDAVLFYHSVSDKAVIGLAEVTRQAYPDPTAKEGDWSAVDIKPVKALKKPRHPRANQSRAKVARHRAPAQFAIVSPAVRQGGV